MQLMAAILTIGALSAKWTSLDDSTTEVAWVHMKGVRLQIPGIPAQDFSWTDVSSCSDATDKYCDAGSSCKSAFQAANIILIIACILDCFLWFTGDVAWKFQELERITKNNRRRKIGLYTAIGSGVLCILRLALLIACWSTSKTLMSDLGESFPDYTVAGIQTAQGLLIGAILFGIVAFVLDVRAMGAHSKEEKRRKTNSMLDDSVAYQLHA